MILVDSDLEPAPLPASTSVKRLPAPASHGKPLNLRLPSTRTFARFLTQAQAATRLQGEVTVLLTTDGAICRLNRRFRGQNKATDVLSFPAEGLGAEEIAGDLAISVPTALRQAVEQGHALSIEIKVLILHGLLHLAGYDHEADTGKMARRERLLREKLRLPKGLIERADQPKRAAAKSAEKRPSGAKAQPFSRGSNVRAKARTLPATKAKHNIRAKAQPFSRGSNVRAKARILPATKAKRP